MTIRRHRDLSASSLPRIYAETGEASPEGEPLTGTAQSDVAVIGAGITGASAALHLAKAGIDVRLLEAEHVGAGGSGRSFGQAVPYLRTGVERAHADLGLEAGERLIAVAASAPALVRDLIGRYAIDCDADGRGLLFAAHAASGVEILRRRQEEWARRGVNLTLLDSDEATAAIGGGGYQAALIEPRGLTLNPLAYVRGLVRAAIGKGARLHTRSPVLKILARAGSWELSTASGSLICSSLIVAAGVQAGHLLPNFSRRILPLRVHEAATEPLPAEVLAGVLEQYPALTDTRRLPSGVRRTGDNRLIVTLSGAVGERGRGNLVRGRDRLRQLFPHLPPPDLAERWAGWIDLTIDQYPRLVETGRGLFMGYGLSGRGIALGTALGRALAHAALGSSAEESGFPGRGSRLRSWPPGSRLAVAAASHLIRQIDDRHAGRAATPIRSIPCTTGR
jgi:glycine/D-amino acid oxidase-like deaminating enzyme